MLEVSERQLKGWERQGLISGGEQFSFADILALRTLLQLRAKRVPSKTIERAVLSLRQKLAHVQKPLSELRISSEGGTISVQLAGSKMEALTGQLLLNFDPTDRGGPTTPFAKPKPSRSSLDREAESWFQRGLTLEETGAPVDQVIGAYEKAVELNPGAAGALVNLGTLYFRMGKLVKAEGLYRKAVHSDPEYALAQFNLGNFYDEQGDLHRAREHYLAALKLNPQYADAYFNLALVSEQMGERMKAVSYWNAYLKLDGSSSWAQVARKQLERLKQASLVHSR
ncbi:MAG: tetratricopeptide repeat protein [Acidobacteriota bacterium]|nr:tetratricopeptide repeat protein [Acidobacteriota bacterium]